jgi:alkaline phosphatase
MQVVSCHRLARVERSYFLVKYGRMGEDLQRTFYKSALKPGNVPYPLLVPGIWHGTACNRGGKKMVTRFQLKCIIWALGVCLAADLVSADKAALIRFGMVTDVHYADREAQGSRFYGESPQKLAEFVAAMNKEKAKFVIELGDYKDQDVRPDPASTLAYARKIEAVLAGFKGRRYHVLGNHDQDSLGKAEFLKQVVNSGIPAGSSFFSFHANRIHFVVLDANFRSDGKDCERGNFDWTDANIPPYELDWLRKDLAAASNPSIVFVHQQLDGEGAYYVKNAAAARRILEESGLVLAVFQGHRHEGAYSFIVIV